MYIKILEFVTVLVLLVSGSPLNYYYVSENGGDDCQLKTCSFPEAVSKIILETEVEVVVIDAGSYFYNSTVEIEEYKTLTISGSDGNKPSIIFEVSLINHIANIGASLYSNGAKLVKLSDLNITYSRLKNENASLGFSFIGCINDANIEVVDCEIHTVGFLAINFVKLNSTGTVKFRGCIFSNSEPTQAILTGNNSGLTVEIIGSKFENDYFLFYFCFIILFLNVCFRFIHWYAGPSGINDEYSVGMVGFLGGTGTSFPDHKLKVENSIFSDFAVRYNSSSSFTYGGLFSVRGGGSEGHLFKDLTFKDIYLVFLIFLMKIKIFF
jgi:hypothetical protein